MGELKLTGNCLKASRPILSFDEIFQTGGPYLEVIKELLTQVRLNYVTQVKVFSHFICSFFVPDLLGAQPPSSQPAFL